MAQSDLPVRPLGTSGVELTVLGLGGWVMGGGDWAYAWGDQDDADSRAAVHRAVELGISWVDTAPLYGHGYGERLLGAALAELPPADRPMICTKLGQVWSDDDEHGALTVDLRPATIRPQCQGSLERLGVDHLDAVFVHWPDHDPAAPPIEDTWAAMDELRTEGLVGVIGVSNFGTDLLDRCEAVAHVDVVEPALSLVNRAAAADILPWCAAHGSGAIVYSPMHSGLLTERWTAERSAGLPEHDWRQGAPDFRPPALAANLALRDALVPIARRHGTHVGQVAIAWALAWPQVTAAIVGARSAAQVDGWIGAAGVTLGPTDLDEIAAAIEATGAGTGPTRPPAT